MIDTNQQQIVASYQRVQPSQNAYILFTDQRYTGVYISLLVRRKIQLEHATSST